MEFEDILDEVGGYGKYQRQLTVFFLMPVSVIIPWFSLNLIFMVSVPDHWCYVKDVASSNLSLYQQRALVSPPDDPTCTMYNVSYMQHVDIANYTPFKGVETLPCADGWRFDTGNYDSTASTKWNLVCSHRNLPSLVLTLQNVGSFIFTPIYGFLSDRYGRKIVLLLLAIVSATTELASVLVDNFILFTVLRVLNGSVLPLMFTLPYLLLLELVAPEMRGHMNGVVNTFWTLGMCILPLIAYLTRDWVLLGIVSSVAAFGILLYWRFLPESPSWLISQGRYTDALVIMVRIGEKNGRTPDKIHLLTKLQTLGESIKKKKEEEKKFSAAPVLKSPRLRRNFFILSFCWTAFNIAYFVPMYNIRNMNGNEFLNFFLLSVVEIPGNFIFWFLMDYIGRRWTATLGLIGNAFVCLLPVTGFPYSDVISAMVAKFIITGVFMVTDQQSAELFPTDIRSFCIGTGKTISGASTLLMPYIADLHVYGKEIPFLIMGLVCFVAGVLASFLPETLNENLPQTISDAEKFGMKQKFFSWSRRKRIPASGESVAFDTITKRISIKDSGDTDDDVSTRFLENEAVTETDVAKEMSQANEAIPPEQRNCTTEETPLKCDVV